MIPPLMSSTLNGEDILGNKNSSTSLKNQDNNEAGRPEKADDEKSEKTIANRESMN
nr:MAG TPA: portal protein [Caudoviricetes sp.]